MWQRAAVFHNTDGHACCTPSRTTGSVNENVLPLPGSLFTQMRPPWASTNTLVIYNPNPMPSTVTSLPDPDKLFNSGLEGKKWRTIDLYAGDMVNESALKVLVRAGVDFNKAKAKPAAKKKPK